ncbi:MAG: hypothetical protein CSA22_07725 [Deltaproteobacteria bacterium]|nr:MAG: hypothetical protein CSA22_07725 [Deltaproteobacteria bacterium]
MARLYLDQGYIEEAIHIWKALMAREPAEAAHSKALADACRKRLTAETRRLSPLFRQWFYLLLQSRNT